MHVKQWCSLRETFNIPSSSSSGRAALGGVHLPTGFARCAASYKTEVNDPVEAAAVQ
jgi:hypothetical protein